MKQVYRKTYIVILVLLANTIISQNVLALLIDRGGGLIYDTDLNITWLQDTLGDCNQVGPCTWDNAIIWAENFVYYDSIRNVYWDDWRLPHGDPSVNIGYDVGEMGHLYYEELGNSYLGGQANFNPGPFLHLDYNSLFWTDTECITDPYTGLGAYVYDFWGYQHQYAKINTFRVWAVRDGDVAPVPEPSSFFLLCIGLIITWRLKKGFCLLKHEVGYPDHDKTLKELGAA